MKLRLASDHSYKPEHVEILKAYVGREITVQQLPELARRVPIAIVAAESDDTRLAIDHPHAW